MDIANRKAVTMQNEQLAIQSMISYSASIVGMKATENEVQIATEIAKNVIQGKLHKVYIENATREQRKRLVAIAFNLVKSRKKFWCRNCDKCMRSCYNSKILQRRFAEEMFPGMKIY